MTWTSFIAFCRFASLIRDDVIYLTVYTYIGIPTYIRPKVEKSSPLHPVVTKNAAHDGYEVSRRKNCGGVGGGDEMLPATNAQQLERGCANVGLFIFRIKGFRRYLFNHRFWLHTRSQCSGGRAGVENSRIRFKRVYVYTYGYMYSHVPKYMYLYIGGKKAKINTTDVHLPLSRVLFSCGYTYRWISGLCGWDTFQVANSVSLFLKKKKKSDC